MYNLSISQLQEILGNIRSVIWIHEHIFILFSRYVNIWENQDLDIPFIQFHEQWREIGNNITETYRRIEDILGISREQSAFPTQFYEDP